MLLVFCFVLKKSSARYCQKNKERLQAKKSCERHQNLSEENKEKNRQYDRKRQKNPLEDERQRLDCYRKIL